MKRNISKGILIVLVFVFVSIPCYAYAADLVELPEINIGSYGSIVYQDANGSVEIYAEDIVLLQEKLESIPEDIFTPAFYSSIHDWQYIDKNEETHTRRCNICGTTIRNMHIAMSYEENSFVYNYNMYDGYNFECKCGYVWQGERDHNYVYTPVDAGKHRVSCALNGTKYCEGLEEYDEEHVLDIEPDTDNTHKVTCSICLYEKDENCDFTEYFQDMTTGEERLICECGNYIVIEEECEPFSESDSAPEKDEGISSNNLGM